MLSIERYLDKGFLHIPIKNGGTKNALQIWISGYLLRDFCVELSQTPDAYFFLDLSAFIGKTLTICVQQPKEVQQAALEKIVCGGDPASEKELYADLYHEKLRPQFHFSSRRGWLNDPNGLVYDNGVYHMFYQHNPLGITHGEVNVSWGHAVSTDLLHWQERSDAIMPSRRDLSIASGSALIDKDGVAGFGKGAMIAAYTCLGTRYTEGQGVYPANGQYFAASTDGGNTFISFFNNPVVKTQNGEGWRDPCIFKYQNEFIMAVYETLDDQNCVAFYHSADLYHWERLSWAKDLFECPDLFPVCVRGSKEQVWVLYGADGYARIGSFDGTTFTDSGISNLLDYGRSTYAGQTWSNTPDNRKLHIAWIRGLGSDTEWNGKMGYEEMPFSQCMSLPCEISVQKTSDGYLICRTPAKEVEALRVGQGREWTVVGGARLDFCAGHEYFLEVTDAPFSLSFDETVIEYNPAYRIFSMGENKCYHSDSQKITLRIFVDKTTVEVFFNEEVAATYAFVTQGAAFVFAGSALATIKEWTLKSIW